jgi:solute carrier family 25 oxoglutarate transporter 11
VRFQADTTLPVDERRNYKHVFDALGRIVKEEGVVSLWTGVGPTIARACAMNISMLVTFNECKERLEKHYGKGVKTIFL